jgi:uncharacterized protein
MSIRFEWDRRKAASNIVKHGISFEEAVTVFADPLARVFDDEDHGPDERREIIVGHSAKPRLLIVGFVQGETGVRILSARTVTRRERRDYQENVDG